MTDYAAARENMVESQVRPNGVTDSRIIAGLYQLPREDFVPEACRAVAYADRDVEVATGRYLIEAMALTKLVQLAEVKPTDNVLHVGATTGYGSALLAGLGKSVVALECDPSLVAQCRLMLAGHGNVNVVEGALEAGWPKSAPFDVILVEGCVAEVPGSLLAQLAEGGRLVAVVGERAMAKAQIWTSHGGKAAVRSGFNAAVAALPGFARKRPAFVF